MCKRILLFFVYVKIAAEIRMISNYIPHNVSYHIAWIDEGNEFLEEIEFEIGLHGVLYWILSNMYRKETIQVTLDERNLSKRQYISNVWFADDTAVIAEYLEDLQEIVDTMIEFSKRNSISINLMKLMTRKLNNKMTQIHRWNCTDWKM